MKKKNLEKAVILGLILSTGVYGTAWADVVGITADGNETTLTERYEHGGLSITHSSNEYAGDALSKYETVKVSIDTTGTSYRDKTGISLSATTIEAPNTNFDITLTNSTGNMNGIKVSGAGDLQGFNIGNYTANISAPNSNALSITESVASKSVINGNFKADVSNGIGMIIAAGAYDVRPAGDNNLIVRGNTNITISNKSLSLKDERISGDNLLLQYIYVDTTYSPAAVYAGDSKPYFNWEGFDHVFEVGDEQIPVTDIGQGIYGIETTGKGIITLEGDTAITINNISENEKAYGLYAGKNGEINVNNVSINASSKDSIAIAAQNGNFYCYCCSKW